MGSDLYQSSASDLSAIRAIAETYGFCLVKQVLSAAEMAELHAKMRTATQLFAGAACPDLLSLPGVQDIYFHPRLLAIARALLGDALVYDGEGNINYEDTIGPLTLTPYTGLHCDARGMPDDLGRYWTSSVDALYRAYRIGIYFQDYRRASGSLKLIVGSHRGDPDSYEGERLAAAEEMDIAAGGRALRFRTTRLPLFNLPSEPGDVVFWNLRTFHSAGAKLFAATPELAVHPGVEAALTSAAPELFAPPPGPRNALFFDYGAPCEELDLYVKHRARPQSKMFPGLCARAYDGADIMARARSHGVEMRLDSIIIAQSVRVSLMQRSADSAADPRIAVARRRIYNAFQQHREYSPHFPLLSPDRFRGDADALTDAVIATVANAVLEPA